MKNPMVGRFLGWLGTLVPLFGLNALFHGVLMAKTFDEQLAGLTIPMGQPNLIWLVLTDVMLACAFVFFAHPRDTKRNVLNGAVLGLLTSGTWNFVNMGVMNGWPMPLMFMDIAWHIGLGAFCGFTMSLCLRKFLSDGAPATGTTFRRAS